MVRHGGAEDVSPAPGRGGPWRCRQSAGTGSRQRLAELLLWTYALESRAVRRYTPLRSTALPRSKVSGRGAVSLPHLEGLERGGKAREIGREQGRGRGWQYGKEQ